MNKKWEKLPWDNIKRVSSHAGLDQLLVGAIVANESSGNTNATRFEPHWIYFVTVEEHAKRLGISPSEEKNNQATSFGLMQLMGGTARELGFRDKLEKLLEPEVGLLWGCLFLTRLVNRYKKVEDVLAAYNGGSPRKGPDGKLEPKLQQYVDRVMKIYSELK